MLRWRWPILAFWLVVLLAGGYSSTKLNALLSNTFTVPGTDSEQARAILARHYGDRSDGVFTIVFRVPSSHDPAAQRRLYAVMKRAAHEVPTGKVRQLQPAGDHVLYGDIVSTLASSAEGEGRHRRPLRRTSDRPGVTSYVTGQAAIQHDLDPVFNQDLRRGELEIAIPAALIVLLLVLGLSAIVTLPLLFAGATIAATLGLVFAVAHATTMATYVTNLVELIGLALAIDYSLLVVYRFREELKRGDGWDEAIVRTMTTAGRSVVFSGATVTLGLALLLFIPVPFIRSLGIGGFLIPLVSIAAAMTLLPALLSFYGAGGSAVARPARTALPRRGGHGGRAGSTSGRGSRTRSCAARSSTSPAPPPRSCSPQRRRSRSL